MTDCTPLSLDGRVVAFVRGDVLDVRRRTKHLLRHPPAVGINPEILRQARFFGAKRICLMVDGERRYVTTLDEFERQAFSDRRGGFEVQLFLELKFWRDATEPTALFPGGAP